MPLSDDIIKLRDELQSKLVAIDPKLLVELKVQRADHLADHFSDWHDRFNDNGRFTDGFGKAGGRPAVTLPQASTLAEGKGKKG